MNDPINNIQQVLQTFQEGYITRASSKLDEFIEHFLSSDEPELIGIGAAVRYQDEWFQGNERIREIMESDWKYWGDVKLEVQETKINIKNEVAWLSTVGAILQTDHLQTDDVTNFSLKPMKELVGG